jgi:hypothetical protein
MRSKSAIFGTWLFSRAVEQIQPFFHDIECIYAKLWGFQAKQRFKLLSALLKNCGRFEQNGLCWPGLTNSTFYFKVLLALIFFQDASNVGTKNGAKFGCDLEKINFYRSSLKELYYSV